MLHKNITRLPNCPENDKVNNAQQMSVGLVVSEVGSVFSIQYLLSMNIHLKSDNQLISRPLVGSTGH